MSPNQEDKHCSKRNLSYFCLVLEWVIRSLTEESLSWCLNQGKYPGQGLDQGIFGLVVAAHASGRVAVLDRYDLEKHLVNPKL